MRQTRYAAAACKAPRQRQVKLALTERLVAGGNELSTNQHESALYKILVATRTLDYRLQHVANMSLDYVTSLVSFTIKQRSWTDSPERVGEDQSRERSMRVASLPATINTSRAMSTTPTKLLFPPLQNTVTTSSNYRAITPRFVAIVGVSSHSPWLCETPDPGLLLRPSCLHNLARTRSVPKRKRMGIAVRHQSIQSNWSCEPSTVDTPHAKS